MKKTHFWLRQQPPRQYDIVHLRPNQLPPGRRFETKSDALRLSLRSEEILQPGVIAKRMAECSCGSQRCHKPSCPLCARHFRRWFIGQLLRLADHRPVETRILTVLLAVAPHDQICLLDANRHHHSLRKQIKRAGLNGVPTIGGFEIAYHARHKHWVLHVNLVIFGAPTVALERFKKMCRSSDIWRPVVDVVMNDAATQLSYVLKFSTYHRPLSRTGAVKGPAKPLNRREHVALVQWMHQRNFTEFLFLFNTRRRGADIVIKEQSGHDTERR